MNRKQDPELDARRRIEEATEAMRSHVEELGRRFHDVRQRIDLESRIAARPLTAVGIAFALGAVLALGGRRRAAPEEQVQRGLGGAVIAGITAIAMRVAKDAAIRQLADAARRWLHEQYGTNVPDSEREASRDPSVEPFLEH